MRVLVTGAAGFLGRHFVGHHLERDDEVTAIDDLSSPYAYWHPDLPATERLTMDAAEFCDPDKDTDKYWDLAYHFAAPVGGREKIEGHPLFNADSLRLDSIFFRWAVNNAKTVVYPSSSAVYGTLFQGKAGKALREDMFAPDATSWYAPDEMYGFTKMVGEVLAWKAASYGLHTLCIRPFSGYGEDQSLEYPVPSIAARVAKREDPLVIWGNGNQRRDFIHVDDVVAATVARLSDGVHGHQAMNIGTGTPVSFMTVATLLARAAGYEPEITTDPSKPQGVFTRYANTSRMFRYRTPRITLADGLERVLRAQEARLAIEA